MTIEKNKDCKYPGYYRWKEFMIKNWEDAFISMPEEVSYPSINGGAWNRFKP